MFKHSMVSEGNVLFKYRGQIPVILFAIAAIFIFFTPYSFYNQTYDHALAWLSIGTSIVGFFIRFIAIGTTPAGTSGRNTQEQVASFLNTKGIYSTVRHPLYLGNYLIWLGIVLFAQDILFALFFSTLYWIYYERIMYAEEDFLHKQYGASYENWALQTPAFIPSFKKYVASPIPFSFKAIFRREYSGILATIIGFAFVDFCIYFFHGSIENIPMIHAYTIAFGLLLVIVSKGLRKFTNVLDEEGRS